MKLNMCEKYSRWIRYITVEPSMALYCMASHIISVVEQAFYLNKSCRVDHGFSEEICNNLTANATLNTQVQVTVSNFLQWNSIAGYTVPIILAVFFGSWSDRRGRKAPLTIALVGKVIEAWMLVVISLMDTWSLNTVAYVATLPMAMLGSDVVIYASCYSYIADVSSSKHRTLRITTFNVVYVSCAPIGVALGSYLFYNVVNSSYTLMFAINGALVVLAVVYSVIRLEMRTTPEQKPMEKGNNLFLDFFDKKHVIDSMTTLTKPRPARRRLYLWILMISVALYAFYKTEKQMSYLYTQLTFLWNVSDYSHFSTFQNSMVAVAMLFGVPIMSKFLGMRDTVIVVIGALTQGSGRIFYALADTPELFYVGGAVAGFGPIAGPVLRSMSSKVVPSTERGKVLALVCVCDKAIPLISAPMYSQLYNATITTVPSAIYWLTFATQVALLPAIMVIHVTLGSRQLDAEADEDGVLCSPEITKKIPSPGPEADCAVRT